MPIAPILKDIQFPSENDVIPGQVAKIQGLGFSREDIVYLKDQSGKTVQAETVEVSDYDISIRIPVEAGGEYTVIIERSGKQTVLEGTFKVPLMVLLEDVVMPSGVLKAGEKAVIKGKGFENGDLLSIYGTHYPTGKTLSAVLSVVDGGVEFTIPEGTYGVSSVVVIRGERKTNLGTISVGVNVGDKIGGGVVYWVDQNKVHGYIVNMTTVGSDKEQFGPEVDPTDAAGTGEGMGTGAQNTINIINKFNALQAANGWPEWVDVTIAAQWCADHSVTEGDYKYEDWFLPSREELIEVFKVKAMLAEQGVNIPANNYWTSSEGPNNEPGWSAYYVNFYEAENLISEICSKSKWVIGVLPVRSF